MLDHRKPDMIVSVDFGMTCTGVAYSVGPHWSEVKNLQKWDGLLSVERRDKVESSVTYDENENLRGWGFGPEDPRPRWNKEWMFKLFLDPSYRSSSDTQVQCHKARQWYRDYLSQLYRYIMEEFESIIMRFRRLHVEFVFSMPNTWRDDAVMSDILELIRQAGFGSRPNDSVSISLTEAEAAAIYAAQQNFRKGETFIVCDAGGGTTDVNLLKIKNAGRNSTRLEPLHFNQGTSIGSTIIDFLAQKRVVDCLNGLPRHLRPADPEEVAERMIRSPHWEEYKCRFDERALPRLTLQIPDFTPGYSLDRANIVESRVILHKDEVRGWFDQQLDGICRLIDSEIDFLQKHHPNDRLSFLLLSGGLCSSAYIKAQLRERYGRGNTNRAIDPDMGIITAEKPQLAVCLGLVHERIQTLRGGSEILPFRRSPASYGILCRQEYKEKKHQGEEVQKDPMDGKRWAENQISWFVKKGEAVSVRRPITKPFARKFALGEETCMWDMQVMLSFEEIRNLPKSMRDPGVERACLVQTELERGDMKMQNGKWYQWSEPYLLAEFDVEMKVGTGLTCAVVAGEGKESGVRGKGKMKVEWQTNADE